MQTTEVSIEVKSSTADAVMNVPKSVQATLDANPSQMADTAPPPGFRGLKIRIQLLIMYGTLTIFAFLVLVAVCFSLSLTVERAVIDTSRSELTSQIINNSLLTMQETVAVLDSRLEDGFNVLVQPSAFLALQYLDGTTTLQSIPSYADQSVSTLKPPLSTDARYHCLPSANDDTTGCNPATRLQLLSTSASSVYVTGAPLTGDPFAAAETPTAMIDGTSTLDWLSRPGWAPKTAWIDSFVAGLDTRKPLFRQYPGAVGNLDASGNERTYNPATRAWYTQTAASGSAQELRATSSGFLAHRPMTITPPYVDLFGRGYLLSVSCPVADAAGGVVGVAGADMSVSSLQAIVTTIRSRETGEAHFFLRDSGAVIASRQLDVDATTVPHIDTLTLPGASLTFADLRESASGASRSLLADPAFQSGEPVVRVAGGLEYQLVWQRAWGDAYVLLTITPMAEIQYPIETQLERIAASVRNVWTGSLVVCLCSLVLLVLLTLNLSSRIAGPMAKTVEQSRKIVRNIGGNLFDGISIKDEVRKGALEEGWRKDWPVVAGLSVQQPGEVAALRGEFLKSLFALNRKRVREAAPKSPFLKTTLTIGGVAGFVGGPYAAPVAALGKEMGEQTREVMEEALKPPEVQPLTPYNRIACKIFCWLLIPTMLAFAVIVSVTAASLFDGVNVWLAPVKDTMVAVRAAPARRTAACRTAACRSPRALTAHPRHVCRACRRSSRASTCAPTSARSSRVRSSPPPRAAWPRYTPSPPTSAPTRCRTRSRASRTSRPPTRAAQRASGAAPRTRRTSAAPTGPPTVAPARPPATTTARARCTSRRRPSARAPRPCRA